MNHSRILCPSLLAASWLIAATITPAAGNECIACHQSADFYVEYPKLREYYQQWLGSPHQQSGVVCDDCHGGNAEAAIMGDAHAGILPMSDEQSTLHYRRQPETCGHCHGDKRESFIQSKHFKALMDQRASPTCTTCHPAMSRRPELRTIVLNACRNCHGPGNSENLRLIAEQAEKVFQQLNIAGGLLGWTRIHFESHDWPADSRSRVLDLDRRYQTLLNQVHQFELQRTEVATTEFLAELREIFDDAQRIHRQQK